MRRESADVIWGPPSNSSTSGSGSNNNGNEVGGKPRYRHESFDAAGIDEEAAHALFFMHSSPSLAASPEYGYFKSSMEGKTGNFLNISAVGLGATTSPTHSAFTPASMVGLGVNLGHGGTSHIGGNDFTSNYSGLGLQGGFGSLPSSSGGGGGGGMTSSLLKGGRFRADSLLTSLDKDNSTILDRIHSEVGNSFSMVSSDILGRSRSYSVESLPIPVMHNRSRAQSEEEIASGTLTLMKLHPDMSSDEDTSKIYDLKIGIDEDEDDLKRHHRKLMQGLVDDDDDMDGFSDFRTTPLLAATSLRLPISNSKKSNANAGKRKLGGTNLALSNKATKFKKLQMTSTNNNNNNNFNGGDISTSANNNSNNNSFSMNGGIGTVKIRSKIRSGSINSIGSLNSILEHDVEAFDEPRPPIKAAAKQQKPPKIKKSAIANSVNTASAAVMNNDNNNNNSNSSATTMTTTNSTTASGTTSGNEKEKNNVNNNNNNNGTVVGKKAHSGGNSSKSENNNHNKQHNTSAFLPGMEKAHPPPPIIETGRKIGAYTLEGRKAVIERFLKHRERRVWKKKIKYNVRKDFADSRLRVKGRFVRKEDEEQLRDIVKMML